MTFRSVALFSPSLWLTACVALFGWGAPAGAFVPAGTNALDSRWAVTASGSTGAAGEPAVLTWSIAPDGTQTVEVDDANSRLPSDLIAQFDAAFGAGPGGADLTQRPWFTYFEQSFDRWSALSGVTFVYEPNDDGGLHGAVPGQLGVRGDVRLTGIPMDGGSGTLAYSYFPQGGGDLALDTDDLDFFDDSFGGYLALRNTIMHELGHGLGLDHSSSSNASFLLEPAIDTSFDGPQHDDLRGIHWMYGDALEKTNGGAGNGSAALATDLGTLSVGAGLTIGAGGTGTVVGAAETDFVGIANEDDDDYFAFTVTEPVRLGAVMTPRGATFNQSGTPFDTTATNDLYLNIYDTDGTTSLIEATDTREGEAETVDGLVIDTPGTYYARVRSESLSFGLVVQFYELGLTAEALLPELLGDFNTDGLVDAADYSVWRDTQGQSVAAWSGADHDGSGQIDAADYALWSANYGQTLGGALAVPEPATALLVATGVASALRSRRRGGVC